MFVALQITDYGSLWTTGVNSRASLKEVVDGLCGIENDDVIPEHLHMNNGTYSGVRLEEENEHTGVVTILPIPALVRLFLFLRWHVQEVANDGLWRWARRIRHSTS